MTKEENIIKYYVICNRLKNIIRTGWKSWNVKRDRLESVAEHIYGVQMLALAMKLEYKYDIDIMKVIMMLAVHELEEIIIGDLTYLQITSDEKKKIGREAIEKVLSDLLTGDEIKQLILEFDEKKTKEALFAYHCDKLECDLQCKLYDEAHFVDPYNQGDSADHKPEIMEKLKSGEITWSSSWMNHDRPKYEDDENFMEVLDYALDNSISLKKI
jgi:putative hydrolase of HD superfamily